MPTSKTDVELMLVVFATVVEGQAATYVSSPFTTGKAAVDWAARNGFDHVEAALASERFRTEVLAVNRDRAARIVAALRAKSTSASPVISPTALPDVPGWAQGDYRYFWGRVIELYAARVVFLDGWQMSSGCAYEYAVAVRRSIPTFDEQLRPLEPPEALEQLALAQAQASSESSAAFLRAVETDVRDATAPWTHS